MPQLSLAVLAALTLLAQARGIEPAEEAHAEAVRLLAQDQASAAEAAARRALAESSLFVPEREIEVAPEKGLVFDEMIEAARTSYRERRARYFRALGLALTAQERWPEGRKALKRSAGLQPTAEIFVAMASHPDIPIEERVDLLVRAYFAPGADQRGIERALVETGAFASGETLQAVVDRERFSRELAAEFPNVDVVVAPLPDVRVATSTGTFVAADLLAEGAVVVLYLPVAGCNRCSEELDGIRRGLGERNRPAEVEFIVGAFVDEQDLEDARRIVRLLGMPIEVGRVDRIPAGIRPASGGEIVMVARRGVMQIRILLDEGSSSRVVAEQVAAVAGLLMEQQPASEARVSLAPAQSDRDRNALGVLIDRAVVLEAGPVPIPNVYEEIDREVRHLLQEATREDATSVLAELARLRGAGEAKARALLVLDQALPETLLAAVKEMAPEVLRQAPPDEGVFYVGLSDPSDVSANRRVLLQRTFLERDASRHFDLIVDLDAAGASPVWVGPEPDQPTGTRLVSTAAIFFIAKDGCRGLRLVGDEGPVYEGCPAHLRDGEVMEEVDVLMEETPPADAPRFHRRLPTDSSQPAPPETALEQAIRLFRDGSYRDAISMFEQAVREIDPVAPYDETDVRYNIARCYQELGEGPRALQVMESIGDAAYQDLVEQRIDELAVATRR